MLKTFFAGLFVALLSSTALGASDQPSETARVGLQHMSAKYILRIGGIRIGKFYLSASIDETSYDSAFAIKAEGLAKFILKSSSSAKASGQHVSRALQPDVYQRTKLKGAKNKTVRVAYEDGVVDSVSFDPPRTKPLKYKVPEKIRRNTVDPVTAMIQILAPVSGTPCDRSFEVFDGKKRFDFVLEPLEAGTEPMGPAPDGAENMVACRAQFVRIAGFKPQDMKKPPQPPFDCWFIKVDGSPYWKAVRITTKSDFGTVIINNSNFEVGAGKIAQAEVQ